MGPEKQWENPNDIAEPAGPCIPEIAAIDYTAETTPNSEVTITVLAKCDEAVIQRYVWSIDSGSTWDTTDSNIKKQIWNIGDTGVRNLMVYVITSEGIASDQREICVKVTAKKPYIVTKIADTVVNQHARIKKTLHAGDADGSIRMYYWGTAENGWCDSAGGATDANIEFHQPEGGPLTVRWGAFDNDGLSVLDTFVIVFNRGPDSITLLKPVPDEVAAFDTFHASENRGDITCSFFASDPDSIETIFYRYIVTNSDGDTMLSYQGNETTVMLTNVEPSMKLSWLLEAKDAFGDSVSSSGTFTTSSTALTVEGMVLIPGGAGNACNIGQTGFDPAEQPIHFVWFADDFMIDSTEVTRESFADLMQRKDSTSEDRLPVSGVTWFDAVMYCNARSNKYAMDTVYRYDSCEVEGGNVVFLYGMTVDFTKKGFRLPTEAEWEYACRQDSLTLYFWGNDASQASLYCWTSENSNSKPHRVGIKKPTHLRLYDMAGNVWEWCNDWFDPSYYSGSPAVDPNGPALGTEKVIRGGSYKHSLYFAQSGTRSKFDPANGNATIGFRTVLTVK